MYNKKIYDESIKKEIRLYILNDKNNELLIDKFLKKYLNGINKKKIISFDIEFNTPPKSTGLREIAIFQLCFHIKHYDLIIFFNPKICSKKTNKLIKKILTHKKIIKIGHGTDSLDITAIYNYLEKKSLCKKFTNRLYDTRFLCEYLNISLENKFCNIYYLLNKYKIVTEKQYTFLEENHKKLGDFWNNFIDIKNLSNEFIDYSLYDTLYLKYLIKQMFLDFDNSVLKLLIQVLQLVLLLKKNIIIFPDINKFNTYFNKNKINLSNLFSNYYSIFLKKLGSNISNIFIIPLFKKPFEKIFMLCFLYKKIYINKELFFQSKNNVISSSDISFIYNSFTSFMSNLKNYKYINFIINQF
jgi:hypothetical protein